MSSTPDFDLSGMSPAEARQYVLEFLRSLKETQRQIAELTVQLSLWKGRAELAQEKGRADMAAQAASRTADVQSELEPLLAEERDLRRQIDLMKDNLRSVQDQFDRSVDTDQLQANLQMLVGEPDHISDEVEKVEAQIALEELKKKMEGGGE